ncbi:LTA synthase family protein [Arthrobacter sp. L77]|uniref:LTA synthase family protein n=1 Tax=Arthrobacter sp. L77 TaxID=1496689 RepID=UPI0005B806BC|nr:LTA synthase family protein [Arthrobacter sp. L77]
MSDPILHVARRVGVVVARVLLYLVLWAGLALLFAAVGIRFQWGEISVNQMLLNLVSVETDGGGGSLVWTGILVVGVLPLLITGGVALWQHSRRSSRQENLRSDDARPRRSSWVGRTVSTVLVAAVVVGGTTAFGSAVGMREYIKAANSEYDLGEYHVDPIVTSDEQKRNLVLIYLESGEATLADDQLFEKDAFASLKDATEAADGWRSIDDLQQYRGGGWTMAGLASTQCGFPLKGGGPAGSSGSPNELGNDVDSYLGGATCLGDVLEEHGYTSVFLGGANASFAAKETFLRSHGYSAVKDLAHWRAAGEPVTSFRSDWGLSDQRLLARAREEIDALHAGAEATGEPFNLSVLTLDTHEPVHVYDYCPVDTQNELTSVFACSMTEVAGFVEYMEEKGYLEDTAVVIMGDHLKHMNASDDFHEQLDDHPNRTIFNRIWVPGTTGDAGDGALRPGVDQLNLYPTVLEAAGLTLKDRQAGLGVSAFTATVPDGSAQAMEPGPYGDLLDSRSADFYVEAWATEDAAP